MQQVGLRLRSVGWPLCAACSFVAASLSPQAQHRFRPQAHKSHFAQQHSFMQSASGAQAPFCGKAHYYALQAQPSTDREVYVCVRHACTDSEVDVCVASRTSTIVEFRRVGGQLVKMSVRCALLRVVHMPLMCKCQTHHTRAVRVVQSGGASVADDVYQRGDCESIGPDTRSKAACDHLEPVC